MDQNEVLGQIIEEEGKWYSHIESLKINRNIRGLLEEYALLKSEREQYGPDESREQKLNYPLEGKFNCIREALQNTDIAKYIKKNKELEVKRLGYGYLGDLARGNINITLFLLDSLKTDFNSDNKQTITIELSSARELDNKIIVDKILDMVDDDNIENSYLFEIISRGFKKPTNITAALKKIEDHYKNPPKRFFVGHEFSNKKLKNLRKTIEGSLREVGLDNKFKPLYLDLEEREGNLLEKIHNQIKETEFGIYDLSKSTKEGMGSLPNLSVTLEVGLSKGIGKRFYIIVKEGIKIEGLISDLGGEIYNPYKNDSELREKLCQIFNKEKKRLGY